MPPKTARVTVAVPKSRPRRRARTPQPRPARRPRRVLNAPLPMDRPMRPRFNHGSGLGGTASSPFVRAVHQIVDPSRANPVVVGTNQKAATAAIEAIQEVNFLAANTLMTANPTYALVPPGDMFVIATRSPLWAQIVYDPNIANGIHTYLAQFNSPNTFPNPLLNLPIISSGVAAQESVYAVRLPIANWLAQTAYAPHGGTYYAASHTDGRAYVWIDAIQPASTTVTFAGSTSAYANGEAVSINLVCYRLESAREEPTIAASAPITFFGGALFSATCQLVDRGYYAFELDVNVKGNAVGNETITLGINNLTFQVAAIDVAAHLPAPGIAPLLQSMTDVRLTGVSILATNVSAELYQSGDVYTTQMSSDAAWDDWIQAGYNVPQRLTSSLPKERWEVQKWQRGGYSWLKPNDTLAGFTSSLLKMDRGGTANVLTTMSFAPYTPCDYLLTYVKSSSSSAAPSALGRFCMNFTLQYGTLTPALGADYTPIRTNQVQDLLDMLRFHKQFYENPLHLAAIFGILRAIGSAFVRAAPTIGKVATAVSAVAGAGSAIHSALANRASGYEAARAAADNHTLPRAFGYPAPYRPAKYDSFQKFDFQ